MTKSHVRGRPERDDKPKHDGVSHNTVEQT
jgi:hypothetical protein